MSSKPIVTTHLLRMTPNTKPMSAPLTAPPFTADVRSNHLFFRTRDDLIHADAEVVVEHEHFAARDEPLIHENVHGITGELIELDDRAFAQLQHVFDEHARSAQLDLHVQ